MFSIPCVIFAGGKSSRMGEDKALLPFASFSTLAEYQQTKLSKLFTHVYISCKEKNNFPFEANFIEDDKTNVTFAPTAGFLASFKASKEGIQPLCGIYHRSLEKEFVRMQKENSHKLGFLLKNSHTNYCYFLL